MAAALGQYRAAHRIRPEEARIEAGLGRTLGTVGRTAEGLRHLERAVELDPRLVSARNVLAVAYQITGRLAEAGAQVDAARAIDPSSAGAIASLARVELARGRWEAAVELLRAALEPPSLVARPELEERLRQLLERLTR